MGMIRTANKSGIWQGVIEPTEAIIHQAINDEYSCEIMVPIHPDTGYDLITRDTIVELPDANGTKQLFRLETPEQTLTTIRAFGWHITQDLAHEQIINNGWEDRTGAYVLPLLVQSGISETRFTGTSDISTVNSLKIVRRSVLSALIGDQDNSFVNRFGGELERDNYTVNMLTRLGADKGYRIAYRKNLLGFSAHADDSGIINRIIPTYLNASDAAVLLPETYIDSPRINETAVPHAQTMHFGDIRVGYEDSDGLIAYPSIASAETAVRNRVTDLYLSGIDQAKVTVEVDFVELRKTKEYKDYQDLETLLIGDSVTLLYDQWTIRERMIAYTWDALSLEYIDTVLGNIEPSMDSLTARISTEIRERTDETIRERYISPLVINLANLNHSVANAAGLFVTEIANANGSKQIYYHDAPTLAESQVIEYYPEPGSRVWTDTGWNDGLPVWLYGNDQHGLLVMRLISTVGLDADWIRTGQLDASRIVVSGNTLDQKINALEDADRSLADQQAAVQAGGSNLIPNSDFGNVLAPSATWWTVNNDTSWDLIKARFDTWDELKSRGLTWDELKTYNW